MIFAYLFGMRSFKVILVLSICFHIGLGQALAETVQIRLSEAINIRKNGDKGALLVRESTLPAGSVIEVAKEDVEAAQSFAYWKNSSTQAPLRFIKGVKVVSAPGLSQDDVSGLNEINSSSGLFMAQKFVKQGKVLKLDQHGKTVQIKNAIDVYSSEQAPPEVPKAQQPSPAPGRKAATAAPPTSDEPTKSVVDSFNDVQAATKTAGLHSRCDAFTSKWLTAGVPKKALENAIAYYEKNQSKIRNKRYITVIDFSAPSTQKRMYVLDTQTGAVEKHYTAHGRGSDGANGYAKSFSGASGSNATPAGFLLASEPYVGSHGLSLRLDGLEARNQSARSRAVVIHGADYVTPEFISRVGRAGRSWGCPAVDPREVKAIIGKIKGGSLIYNYTPHEPALAANL
jgi:hypothetical protein